MIVVGLVSTMRSPSPCDRHLRRLVIETAICLRYVEPAESLGDGGKAKNYDDQKQNWDEES